MVASPTYIFEFSLYPGKISSRVNDRGPVIKTGPPSKLPVFVVIRTVPLMASPFASLPDIANAFGPYSPYGL